MMIEIWLILGLIVAAFLGYVLTRSKEFYYERSGVINAPAEKIFPYLSDFRLGEYWSPYEQMDPKMKKKLIGDPTTVGSVMEFNSRMNAGKIEFLKIVPDKVVELKLTMIKPIRGENLVIYKLTSDKNGTRFTWSMSGNGGFRNQLMSAVIDCEKLVAGQFSQGIQNLKTIIEAQNKDGVERDELN